MYYEDLLPVPYKEFGRDKNGMDCFGLVLEMVKRDGNKLNDFVYNSMEVAATELPNVILETGVIRIDPEERRKGDIVEWHYNENLHCGYLLNKDQVLNMTFSGVRITPYFLIKNPVVGRIKK